MAICFLTHCSCSTRLASYSSSLPDVIAKTIQAEREDAVLSEHHRRIYMLDAILGGGETLGFCPMDAEDVQVAAGGDAWIDCVNSASMSRLRSRHIAVTVLLSRAAARQRLVTRVSNQ